MIVLVVVAFVGVVVSVFAIVVLGASVFVVPFDDVAVVVVLAASVPSDVVAALLAAPSAAAAAAAVQVLVATFVLLLFQFALSACHLSLVYFQASQWPPPSYVLPSALSLWLEKMEKYVTIYAYSMVIKT